MKETQHELNERQELLLECQRLIRAISKSPYSIKLLKAAREALLIVAGYKANRSRRG